MSGDRGERLDELNAATFRRHWLKIRDDGIGDPQTYKRSALPGLLADLRANAEQVYGEPSRTKRANGV